MSNRKPYAESCDQNKRPILEVLSRVFTEPCTVVEIGSGTGQHAVYFAGELPHLQWQPTDRAENLPGIEAWRNDAELHNVHAPLELDVAQPWPVDSAEAVFSANSVHIMSWPEVEDLFDNLGRVMKSGARFCLYGPFNYGGRYTSESNARFDDWLKARDPQSGIRDVDDLDRLAEAAGMERIADYEMPANNRTLVWMKR